MKHIWRYLAVATVVVALIASSPADARRRRKKKRPQPPSSSLTVTAKSPIRVDGDKIAVPVDGAGFTPPGSPSHQPVSFDVREIGTPTGNKAANAGQPPIGASGTFTFNVVFGDFPYDCGRTFSLTASQPVLNAGTVTPRNSNTVEFSVLGIPGC